MIASLEELKFEGGYPTAETIQKVYDQLDLQRVAQVTLILCLQRRCRPFWTPTRAILISVKPEE